MKTARTNQELQQYVIDELDWEQSVDAARIGVSVEEGVVTLSGHVPVLAEKRLAEQAAKRVQGVMAVANDIEVCLGEHHQRDDTDLAAAAVHALQWNAKVPHERLQVTVNDGWIRVEGVVDHNFQRDAAGQALQHLVGARGVTNSIRVEPTEEHVALLRDNRADVCERIQQAMKRHVALANRDICAEFSGRTLVLSGDVHSHAEMEAALQTAWSAPGIENIDNAITITPWGSGPAEEWGY